jgi:hypothetical protein
MTAKKKAKTKAKPKTKAVTKTPKEEKPDLELLGAFIWYFPEKPDSGQAMKAPTPDDEGKCAGLIVGVGKPYQKDGAKDWTQPIDVRVWDNHGLAHVLKDVRMWGEGDKPTGAVVVYPEDNEARVKEIEEAQAEADEAKAEQAKKDSEEAKKADAKVFAERVAALQPIKR